MKFYMRASWHKITLISPGGIEPRKADFCVEVRSFFCNFFEFTNLLMYDVGPEQVFVMYRSDDRLQIPETECSLFYFQPQRAHPLLPTKPN